MTCVFLSPHLWATVRAVFPGRLTAIAATEAARGRTIPRDASIGAPADRGTPHPVALCRPHPVAQAEDLVRRLPVRATPRILPTGAFGAGGGPT